MPGLFKICQTAGLNMMTAGKTIWHYREKLKKLR
jgi:hypothetical protein